jgi:hypothetical protein
LIFAHECGEVQESPIVFFSMATSSGEDVPRNPALLFSRNPLNVAISRAQCLAISIEEMELVNALCRLAEYAEREAVLVRYIYILNCSD